MESAVAPVRPAARPVRRRLRLPLVALSTVAVATISAAPAVVSALSAQHPEPYVLRWNDDPNHPRPAERRTELGLVYTPDVLSALAARHPADAVPPHIAEAIGRRTPIVVMWEFLRVPHRSEPQRPYQLRILEQWHDRQRPFPPLWIQQDAAGLQELDPRLSTPVGGAPRGAGVAVMAAFPPDAFVPGRIVHLQSQSVQMEDGMWTSANVYAGIEPPLAAALRR